MKAMKPNRLLKTFFTLALAIVMCLTTALPAFAAGSPVTGGTEANPLTAAITKTLKMPEGTTTPATEFIFQFEKTNRNGSTASADLDQMPSIGTVPSGQTAGEIKIPFATTDNGSVVSGSKIVSKQSTNILNGITFPSAGTYTYTLTEKTNTYTAQANETMDYSPAVYTMTFYVKNNSANTGTYVYAISTVIVTPDPGNPGEPGDKVDPTPGDGSTSFSQLAFTNVFTKRGGGTDPTDPAAQALAISKTVTGEYGNQSAYFDYSVLLTQPAEVTGTATYKAYVVEGTNVVTSSANTSATLLTDANSHPYFEVTPDNTTPFTVKLKHGQKLVFTDVYVGARYEAEEQATAGYTPAVSVTVNGGTPISITGTEGAALSTNDPATDANRLVGENKNAADFTNDYTATITPTGVIIDNLPFIMILLLAVGAFIGFIFVKSRKKRRYTSHY